MLIERESSYQFECVLAFWLCSFNIAFVCLLYAFPLEIYKVKKKQSIASFFAFFLCSAIKFGVGLFLLLLLFEIPHIFTWKYSYIQWEWSWKSSLKSISGYTFGFNLFLCAFFSVSFQIVARHLFWWKRKTYAFLQFNIKYKKNKRLKCSEFKCYVKHLICNLNSQTFAAPKKRWQQLKIKIRETTTKLIKKVEEEEGRNL